MKLPKFLGRQRELAELEQLTHKAASSMVVVSGRRRIGKSRLIQEFGNQYQFYSFTGLPPSVATNASKQREYFATRMAQQFTMPTPTHDEWADLFWFLADRVKSGRIVLLLDELSWMAQGDDQFLGKLKNAWDDHFKQNAELILVLCSSVSIWLEKNILADKGFMGRRSLHLHLNELSLSSCDKFWGKHRKQISAYEKLKFLSVTGGVPRYLEELKPSISAEENIKGLCFNKSGVLFTEFDEIFSDIFTTDTDKYLKIVTALATGTKSYQDICDALQTEPNSLLTSYLTELEKAGFISRDYTWHLATRKHSKLSKFRLSDNYMRFYLKFILPKRTMILANEYIEQSIDTIINWQSVIGLQFENLVLNNRQQLKKLAGIMPGETIADGPYFQRKTSKHAACQIDYLVQTKFNNVYLFEIKFSKNEIGLNVVQEVQDKITKLALPRGFSCRAILVHVNGVKNSVIDSGVFANIVNFSQFLE